MRDLTGAPAFLYKVAETDDLFEKILNANDRLEMIVAGSDTEEGVDKEKAEEVGLVLSHCYTVI